MALSPQPIPPMAAVIPPYRAVELGKLNNKFSYPKDPEDRAWFAVQYQEEVLEVLDVTVIGFDNLLKCGSAVVPDNSNNRIGLFLYGGTQNCTYRLRIGVVTAAGDVIYNLVHLDVVYVGMQGAPLLTGNVTDGPQTIAGAASGLVPMLAGDAIHARRVLMSDLIGGVIEADPLNASYVFIGISLQAAVLGAAIAVSEVGAIVDPDWTWTPGSPLYVVEDGLLSETPPTTGFLQQIGVAISPTAIIIQTGPRIDLGGTT